MAEEKKRESASATKTGDSKKKATTEEREVKSEDLLSELKKIVKEGNVRRIIVKSKDGRELLNFSLTVGLLGLVLAPFWLAVAAIVGLAKEFTIVIERKDD